MTTFVVGGTGKTGIHVVKYLVDKGEKVKVVVRPSTSVPRIWMNNDLIKVIKLELSDIDASQLAEHIADCEAIASCLGHRTIYGRPRHLVSDAVRKLCASIQINNPHNQVKFVLMNTAGYHHPKTDPPLTFFQKVIIRLLRVLLPPHPDNEQAASYLHDHIGKDHINITWVVVRPDNLTLEEEVTPYEVYPAPTRDPFFKPGKTSRANVGHFMASLITDTHLWNKWKGQMPVIYNE